MKLEVISREPEILKFGAPLLFVHGSCGAAWNWDENFLPYFAEKGFSSHAVSLRGHGKSEIPENFNSTSVADYVSDVLQVIKTLPEMPVLIGHSLGGLVVQKLLEKHQAPSGILVCSVPSGGMFAPSLPWQIKNPLLFTKVTLKRDINLLFNTPKRARKFLFSEDTDAKKIAEYAARFGRESFRIAFETVFNLPKPESVKTPLLVVGAERDELITPKFVEKTARAYNADYKILPRLAHAVMLERNWQTAADFMINWLRKKVQGSKSYDLEL